MHLLPLESNMMEVGGLLFVLCAFHSTLKLHTWPLWPSCIETRDWWPEGRGSHSFEFLTWQGGCLCIYCIVNSLPCSVCRLLLPNRILQEEMASRPAAVPVGYPYLAERFICGRWPLFHGQWPFLLSGDIPQCSVNVLEPALGLVQFSEA